MLELSVNYTLDKGVGKVNEDNIVINHENGIYGVFDGATGLVKLDLGDETGGSIASKITSIIFSKNSGETLRERVLRANQDILQKMQELGVDTSVKENLFSTTSAVVQILDGGLEYLKVTDSVILMISDNGEYKFLGRDINHDEESLRLIKNLRGIGINPNDSEEVKEQLLKVRRTANKNYGVINGELNLDFVDNGKESLDGYNHVLIFSDGLYPTNEDGDYSEIVKVFLELGVEGLKKHIRDFEIGDPDFEKVTRFKLHDDLAIVSIKIQ